MSTHEPTEYMAIPYDAFEFISPGHLDSLAMELEDRGRQPLAELLTAIADTLEAHNLASPAYQAALDEEEG